MFYGKEYSAYDLLDLWDRFKDSPMLGLFEGVFKDNRDAIEQQFADDGVQIPDDVQAYLDSL